MRRAVTLGAIVGLVALSACTKDQFLSRTATGLDAVQVGTDVAWSLSVEEALREQSDYVASLEALKAVGGIAALPPRAEVVARLAAIRAKWSGRFTAFRAVRLAHAAALAAYEAYAHGDGGLEGLVTAFASLLDEYHELQALLGPVPGNDFELPEVTP